MPARKNDPEQMAIWWRDHYQWTDDCEAAVAAPQEQDQWTKAEEAAVAAPPEKDQWADSAGLRTSKVAVAATQAHIKLRKWLGSRDEISDVTEEEPPSRWARWDEHNMLAQPQHKQG